MAQKKFKRIASTFPPTENSWSSINTLDPEIQQVDDSNDEEFCNYVAALSSAVSQSPNDIAPPKIDDDAILLYPKELMNDESSLVCTIRRKSKRIVRIYTFNPNGLQPEQLLLQLQICVDNESNIQCYNKINCDVTKSKYQQKYTEIVKWFDCRAQDIWGNSYLHMDSDWKPKGTRIFLFGSVSGQIKKSGFDLMEH